MENVIENVIDQFDEYEEAEFPWLIFKIKDNLYTVNSKIINTIVKVPEKFTIIPNVPKYIKGLIHLRGSVIPLIDLRILFNVKSVKEEYDEFKKMIDDRKNDYVNWVNEFEIAIKNNEKFQYNENSHECSFDNWYNNFTTNIETVNSQLKKLDEPNKNIQKAFDEADRCSRGCNECKREKCLKAVAKEIKENNLPSLLSLLDEVKESFIMNYKQMAVVLENENGAVGIVVDEVLSVDNIIRFEDTAEIIKMCKDKYVCGVAKGEKSKKILLILDEEKIMNSSEI